MEEGELKVMIEQVYQKLGEIESKIDEMMLAVVPEEEPTQEERELIAKGRYEIKDGKYARLEDVRDLFE